MRRGRWAAPVAAGLLLVSTVSGSIPRSYAGDPCLLLPPSVQSAAALAALGLQAEDVPGAVPAPVPSDRPPAGFPVACLRATKGWKVESAGIGVIEDLFL